MILPMHVVKHGPHSYLIKMYWPALVFKIMFVSLYNFYIKLEIADNKFFIDLECLCLYYTATIFNKNMVQNNF